MAGKELHPIQKIEAANEQVNALAIKIAPLLRELRAELARNHVSPKTRTASYILLVAAAGFLIDELGDRRVATPLITEVADGVAQHLVSGPTFYTWNIKLPPRRSKKCTPGAAGVIASHAVNLQPPLSSLDIPPPPAPGSPP